MSGASCKEKSRFWGASFLIVVTVGLFFYRFIASGPTFQRKIPPPKPEIIARAEWGARHLNLEAPEEFGRFDLQANPSGVMIYPDNLHGALNTAVVHHSAYPNADPKDIQDLHMDRRGFADVAYHFLIDSNGIIYEGREINIRGAHVQGFNTGSVGIVLLGNFNDEQPTEEQLDSLRGLLAYLRYNYEIEFLAGHKDYPNQSPAGTECPGANLYPLLHGLAQELGMKYGIGGYVSPERIE